MAGCQVRRVCDGGIVARGEREKADRYGGERKWRGERGGGKGVGLVWSPVASDHGEGGRAAWVAVVGWEAAGRILGGGGGSGGVGRGWSSRSSRFSIFDFFF